MAEGSTFMNIQLPFRKGDIDGNISHSLFVKGFHVRTVEIKSEFVTIRWRFVNYSTTH